MITLLNLLKWIPSGAFLLNGLPDSPVPAFFIYSDLNNLPSLQVSSYQRNYSFVRLKFNNRQNEKHRNHRISGCSVKEETLQTVDHYVLENTLVLENIEPFPGYHGENLPTGTKPESLFLITDKTYPVETIFRASQHLCCYPDVPIDACPVEIGISNSKYSGIRIRGLDNYSLISEIQGCFIEKKIGFMKKKKINAPGLMRIIKIFSMEKLDNHIFGDLEDNNTFYLDIPYHFNWDRFRNITMHVKNNLDNSNFDCALGFIYQKEMKEFVRVYIQNTEVIRLKLIREKYLEEIVKIRDDAL